MMKVLLVAIAFQTAIYVGLTAAVQQAQDAQKAAARNPCAHCQELHTSCLEEAYKSDDQYAKEAECDDQYRQCFMHFRCYAEGQ